ncbi:MULTISPECIES: sodium/glutamate symporter [Halomonas]|uniref:sodium/glutamate symporter n=1 Tax=Halomonas TaxID=2745 RepID=UPI001C9745E8|nr:MULTISPECIES: sodium/glutamate symporter [Halomonas]MBY6207951.1 sodium/glutamate symporter [Halomonas sp. DP3Y7-2]MBY6228760.1 sodium/glutamate symporter [Halomonas sp. DP3Y7-1]MCA0917256.1 sodium/glutamate symporter [Halomonas denitrificans]
MDIHFDIIQTAGMAGGVFLLGKWIKARSSFLQKFFFPAPVIGGIIVSLLVFFLHQSGVVNISFDKTLMSFFMNIFFTCVGFTVSAKLIRSSGRQGAVLAVIAVTFLIIQNVIGVSLSRLLGIDELLGIAMGSISMSGGVGSGAAFGPTLESLGAQGATAIGIAAATFGLMMGSLIGGPVAKRLIDRHRLAPTGATTDGADDSPTSATAATTSSTLLRSTLLVLIAAAIGTLISLILTLSGIKFPYYVGCLFGGALVRNIADYGVIDLCHDEVDMVSTTSLNLFLSISLMSLNISALIDLALPMMAILLTQMVTMMTYAYFVTFRLMGKDYDAAVMAAGHCGVGLGQTPNALANMSAVINEKGPSPKAWFILPVITVVFINIFNPLIITFFINLFQ